MLDGTFGYDRSGTTTLKLFNGKDQFTEAVCQRLAHVTVESEDGKNVIRRYDCPEAFHFVDPPYVGSDCGHYSDTFNEQELGRAAGYSFGGRGQVHADDVPAREDRTPRRPARLDDPSARPHHHRLESLPPPAGGVDYDELLISPYMEPNTIHTCDALTGLRLLPTSRWTASSLRLRTGRCATMASARSYGRTAGRDQLGLEPTREEFIAHLCLVFDECRRVLKPSGTLWVNLGDSYSKPYKYNRRQDPKWSENSKNNDCLLDIKVDTARHRIPSKSLCNIPNKFADEMILRGWVLRNEIIWHKPACMPASVRDRFTVDFEKIFFFTKSAAILFRAAVRAVCRINFRPL